MFDPSEFLDNLKGFVNLVTTKPLFAIFAVLLMLAGYGGYSVIASFVPLWVDQYAGKRDSIEKAALSDIEINKILQAELNHGSSSRTVLFRFHDSVKDLMGIDFFYASATNAAAAPGISLFTQNQQNIPASTYVEPVHGTSAMTELLAHRAFYTAVSDMSEGTLKTTLMSHGSKFVLWVGVYNPNGDIIGFISEAWFLGADVPQGKDMDAHIELLKNDAGKISWYLARRVS